MQRPPKEPLGARASTCQAHYMPVFIDESPGKRRQIRTQFADFQSQKRSRSRRSSELGWRRSHTTSRACGARFGERKTAVLHVRWQGGGLRGPRCHPACQYRRSPSVSRRCRRPRARAGSRALRRGHRSSAEPGGTAQRQRQGIQQRRPGASIGSGCGHQKSPRSSICCPCVWPVAPRK